MTFCGATGCRERHKSRLIKADAWRTKSRKLLPGGPKVFIETFHSGDRAVERDTCTSIHVNKLFGFMPVAGLSYDLFVILS